MDGVDIIAIRAPRRALRMSANWLDFLKSRGARIAPGGGVHFGDPDGELRAARAAGIVAPLLHLTTLGFSGPDATAFLQGQVSCDVERLDAAHAAHGCYCTPQGRMLANFLLWRDAEELRMSLSDDIADAVQKRLRMYVLRSKVAIAVPAPALLGVAGTAGAQALREALGAVPAAAMDLQRVGGVTVIRLHGERFLLVAPSADAPTLWERLAALLAPVGTATWQWLDIVAGVPLVTAPTQDQFVPQMVNLELIGGVDFRKGCYTGQEVIARAQHRGKVKRRMFLAHVAADAARAGDPVLAGGDAEASGGLVVNAAPSPEGGTDLLAVLQSATANAGNLHLGTPEGPLLEVRPLPYGVE